MIDIISARRIVSRLDGGARIISLDDCGREGVAFRAFNTDATLTISGSDTEKLIGVVIFAEIQDVRLDLELVNFMNQRINFGSVKFYEPNVVIVNSGMLFDPASPSDEIEKLLTAWSDTIDQFWDYLSNFKN
jgi:Putative bacterial sensory transduction regulator